MAPEPESGRRSVPPDSLAMRALRFVGRDDVAWAMRRLHVPVEGQALVLEVGSGGNPFPRANVLLDAYEVTRERHYQPLIADRPIVLGRIEDMPFRDDAFDFVIACHVLEHSTNLDAALRELQRVARAGYIECPDAFLERINPYPDHRYEVTERNGSLVTRRKGSWIRDAELVELYEHQVKKSKKWPGHLRHNAFAFHVRHFWSRNTGGIQHVDLSTPDERLASFLEPPKNEQKPAVSPTLRSRIRDLVRGVVSQRSRNQAIDLISLLRCVSCHHPDLVREPSVLRCPKCGRKYPANPIPHLFPESP